MSAPLLAMREAMRLVHQKTAFGRAIGVSVSKLYLWTYQAEKGKPRQKTRPCAPPTRQQVERAMAIMRQLKVDAQRAEELLVEALPDAAPGPDDEDVAGPPASDQLHE